MWRGHLKLSLVMVPVKLYAASEAKGKVSFHRLHAECKGQTENKIFCPQCAEEIESGDTVKGYEYARGQHVIVTPEELDAVAADSALPMEITAVTDEPINPAFIDGTYYLVPDDKGYQAFETIRVALGERLALATVVMRDRDLTVALEAQPEGFIVYKLRGAEQVRTFSEVSTKVNVTPSKAEVGLATQLLDQLSGTFSYESHRDAYNERLKSLIESKLAGVPMPVTALPTTPQMVSLTDALTKSLELAQIAKKPATPDTTKLPAKASKAVKVPTVGKKRKRA
jgi:DNA end-binding protein Ku